MGWNDGYTIYEKTVIEAYNTGSLTPKMLRAIIAPYKNTDIDHGGRKWLTANDGLDADEIVLMLLSPAEYEAHRQNEDFDFTGAWQAVMGAI